MSYSFIQLESLKSGFLLGLEDQIGGAHVLKCVSSSVAMVT